METDLLTRVMKHKSKIFIEPRLIFDKQLYEKLINKTTKSNDVHDEGNSEQQGSEKFHPMDAENANNLQWETVIGQEYAINISCGECDASKSNKIHYENVSIKLSLPRCLLNHGNGNAELNYSSFEKGLIEKSKKV